MLRLSWTMLPGTKKKLLRTEYLFLRKMILMIMLHKIQKILMIVLKMSFILKEEKV